MTRLGDLMMNWFGNLKIDWFEDLVIWKWFDLMICKLFDLKMNWFGDLKIWKLFDSLIFLLEWFLLGYFCSFSNLLSSLATLHQLGGKIAFGAEFVAYIYAASHHTNTSSYRFYQFHFQDHRIAGNHFLLEFTIIYFQK